jgi:hypothetical protein
MSDYANKQPRAQGMRVSARASEPSPGKRTLTEQVYGGIGQQRANGNDSTVNTSPAHGVATTRSAPPQGDRGYLRIRVVA